MLFAGLHIREPGNYCAPPPFHSWRCAMAAMMQMVKFDIKKLQAAYDGR
jgi:hypothetical protein